MFDRFKKSRPAPAEPVAAQAPPQTGVPAGLVSLVKTAGVSLAKAGVPTGQRAAVYLVIDRSWSMRDYFSTGAVQNLADQALGLSANLDDDGTVPLMFFDDGPYPAVDISLDRYTNVVAEQHRLHGGQNTMGGTQYAVAMRAVIEHYRNSGATAPALVIFQTDGDPMDRDETRLRLAQASKLPIFWAFVGFGRSPLPFLQQLDTLGGRVVDNASYFHAGVNPAGLPDSVLYDGLTAEFGTWLTAARQRGLLP
ncbi:VWA domain-containing protein [Streptomyces sp. NPDC015684]|uniref:VWA domain-containing protein n=1 Tax=Streptomyces sp. NPDC015684 TaxID=3364963 RepID=UPI0036FF01B1